MNVRASLAALACVATGSCLAPAPQTPRVDLELGIASQSNYRGMVRNEHGVLEAEMSIGLDAIGEGALDFVATGIADMTDDPGDAYFRVGSAGHFNEIDFKAVYSRNVEFADLSVGVASYVATSGALYSLGKRGETNELFVALFRDFEYCTPEFVVHYDVDEVDDFYLEAAASRAFDIDERFGAEARVHLGFSGKDQSEWNYGASESGLADLGAEFTLAYTVDESTTVRALLAASTIVDSEIGDAFDALDIEQDNFWGALSVTWSY